MKGFLLTQTRTMETRHAIFIAAVLIIMSNIATTMVLYTKVRHMEKSVRNTLGSVGSSAFTASKSVQRTDRKMDALNEQIQRHMSMHHQVDIKDYF